MHNIKTAFLILFFFFSFNVFSQSEDVYNSLFIPSELKTKANAVVRYETKIVDIISYDKISVSKKRIVTVLNKYGNKYMRASQYYDSNVEIKEMNAVIFDSNGKEIRKIKKRDFTDVSAVSDISIYEDDRVKYLTYVPLKYPYTVEYTSNVIYNNTAFFPKWQPVDDYYVSTEYSEYKILNATNVGLKTKKENFEKYNIKELGKNHFVAKNILGVGYEIYAPELKTITPQFKAAFKVFNMLGVKGVNNNWVDFGKWMYDRLLTGTDFIPQQTIDEVKKITEGVESEVERAKLVYKYMQDKTRYISIQVGIGGWKPMMAEDVDRLGYADCKGLTNYTKALLEAVEVPSYYTVVYGGRSIRNIDSDFSSLEGNHVILCVPNGNENIFLECTSQTTPFGFIAGFTDDRNALLVKPEGGCIVRTKQYNVDESVQNTKAQIILDNNGSVFANVNIVTTGFQYSMHEAIESKTLRDKKLYYKDYWDYINDISVGKVNVNNDKDAVVFNEKIELSSLNYASKSGNRLILQPNVFNRVTKIPSRYSERKLGFKIDRSFKDVDEFVFIIPKGFKVEAMTKNKNLETKFGTYKYNLEMLDGNKLKYTRTYILNKGNYQKEDYDDFRAFKKEIVKNDKSKIVLVRI